MAVIYNPEGERIDLPDDQVQNALSQGYTLQGPALPAWQTAVSQVIDPSQQDPIFGGGSVVAPVPAQPTAPVAVPVSTAPARPVSTRPATPAPARQQAPAAPSQGNPLSDEGFAEEEQAGLQEKADLLRQQSQQEQQNGDELYTQNNLAAELSLEQAEDYKNLYNQFQAQRDQDMKRVESSYKDLDDEAGKLQDPTNQYYEDHGGFFGKLGAGIAAFASGLGAGLLGSASNPMLDYINNHIQANFESHKQNVKDLYDKQVAAGRMADSNQNWAMFQKDAKSKYYEIEGNHITHKLNALKDRATSQTVKNAIDLNINGVKQEITKSRHDLFSEQAKKIAQQKAAAAAAAAAREARAKELRGVIAENYKSALTSGMTSEQASHAAFQAARVTGASNLELSGSAAALGLPYDPNSGRFESQDVQAPGKGGASNMSEGDNKINYQLTVLPRPVETVGSNLGLKRDKNGKWVTDGFGTTVLDRQKVATATAAARTIGTGLSQMAEAGGAPNESLTKQYKEAFDTLSQTELAALLNETESYMGDSRNYLDQMYPTTGVKKPDGQSQGSTQPARPASSFSFKPKGK